MAKPSEESLQAHITEKEGANFVRAKVISALYYADVRHLKDECYFSRICYPLIVDSKLCRCCSLGGSAIPRIGCPKSRARLFK